MANKKKNLKKPSKATAKAPTGTATAQPHGTSTRSTRPNCFIDRRLKKSFYNT